MTSSSSQTTSSSFILDNVLYCEVSF
jgi:hypothetical protein